jgi:two-component system chemotaxis response regulator CheB
MIRVLIVDDSIVSRQLLKYIFYLSGDIEVVAEAKDGEEALDIIDDKKAPRPDIVTMDVEMPGLDGYETTRRILERLPLPIVIISNAMQYYSAEKAFRAMQAGAVAAVGKPPGLGSPDFYEKAKELIDLVKKTSGIKVRTRPSIARHMDALDEATHESPPTTGQSMAPPQALSPTQGQWKTWILHNQPDIVAIGASTGGPPAIQEILAALPSDFPLPIVVVQHIASGLAKNFAEWLDKTCPLHCKLAEDGEQLQPGIVYVAPDDRHAKVLQPGIVQLQRPGGGELIVPAAEVLFHSVAQSYGAGAVGILLSGMGRDGAKGLLELKKAGALTIAQDRESSVVYGMPGEAEKLGAACCHAPPSAIADILMELYYKRSMKKERTP